MMMSTIYCNSCYCTKSTTPNKPFFCTSCSHIFCQSCLHNYENFCIICKAKCKVLEINDEMPSSVKIYFEACERKIIEAEKIFTFQMNQCSLYVAKNKDFKAKYYSTKTDAAKINKFEKDVTIAMKEQSALIEKLKQSYKTKQINPSLLKEPQTQTIISSNSSNMSSFSAKSDQAPPISHSEKNSFFDSAASSSKSMGSGSSSFFDGHIQSSSTPKQTPNKTLTDNIQKMNLSINDQRIANERMRQAHMSQLSQRISQLDTEPGQPKNVFRETRRSLLENTLMKMQNSSQTKFNKMRHNFN